MNVAIIGTAGRKQNPTPDWGYAESQVDKALDQLTAKYGELTLVSGGAAWADHLAVQQFLKRDCKLRLFLPATFGTEGFDKSKAGSTAAYYHLKYWKETGVDSITELKQALASEKCEAKCYPGVSLASFFDRNTDVANLAEIVIAITYGSGKGVADGGTLDTVKKFLKRGVRPHVTHIDLSTHETYLANPGRILNVTRTTNNSIP